VGAVKAPTIQRSYPCQRSRQSASILPSQSSRFTELMLRVVICRQLKRRYMLAFFEKLPPRLIGIEACASSHHWSRELQALGHSVRLMPPAYVKPYVKRKRMTRLTPRQSARRNMRFVPTKTPPGAM
jgi:transposase